MSKLDRLIAELCPDGVEYKTLGEVATNMYRGAGIKREEVTDEGAPCVRYGEIYTTYGIWFDSCVSHTQAGTKTFEHGDILFAITGESVAEIAKSCAYIGHEKCYAGGDIVVMKHNQNPKYISYALSTVDAQTQKSKGKVKSKVVHSSVPALCAITIPLPPLPVQQEIVRILDSFTALEAELKAKLEAELEARKKQYEYCCRSLINNNLYAKKIKLRDLGEWSGGGTPSTQNRVFWEGGTIPWITSKDMIRTVLSETQDHITPIAISNSPAKLLPKNTVALVVRSGILRHTLPIAFIPFEATVNQDLKALITKPEISAQYVAFALRANHDELLNKTKKLGGTVESIVVQKLLDFTIPVPPLEEQARIVAILDKFDALVNDISQGLPAEIAARRKQYEYYRDKLLTFKEKS